MVNEVEYAIQVSKLDFAYERGVDVLSNVNLNVTSGSIYGFLGRNGAGKSTTLRTILGLIKPNRGSISILGKKIKESYPSHLHQIGSLIENPSLYGHLTARHNLKVCCNYFNVRNHHIDRVLDTVNLGYARNKKVKRFSTGMKQRLGLAIAMLQDPQILILDEPTNGLDPNGIIEFRDILLTLRERGKTILLSSHILSEVEKIASQIGIIHEGKMVFEGTLEALHQMKKNEVLLRTSDPILSKQYLSDAFLCTVKDNGWIAVTLSQEKDIAQVIKHLVEQQIDVFSAIPVHQDLEEMFLSITDQDN